MLLPSQRHRKLFFLLAAWTVFIASMIFVRIWYTTQGQNFPTSYGELKYTRGFTFAFLGWNLVLAWVPYLLSLGASALHRNAKPVWLTLGIGLVWLAFLPNAPYIVTDLLHLSVKKDAPLWFDVMLIFSAAWTGLLLGFLSLREVHKIVEYYFDKVWKSHAIMISILALTAYGVWLGRFHRWNSWDLLTRPGALFADIYQSLTQMPDLIHTWAISGILFVFLSLGYYTMFILSARR